MAVISDGGQKFGITTTLVSPSDSFVVESFTENFTSNRVDLDNGSGEPLGSVTGAGRTEISMTAQFGASSNAVPTVGDTVTYGGRSIILTDVTVNEAQADFVRLDLAGYVKTN
jgi:hypothetical protein